MEKITKKTIREILRTMDRSQIFNLTKKLKGDCQKYTVKKFIEEYAPIKKIYRKAFDIAYNGDVEHPRFLVKSVGAANGMKRKEVVDFLIENIELAKIGSAYAKLPFKGVTNLYFCSPTYGHSDYNKYRAISIKGNEEFCDILLSFAHKKIQY
jgi:hypothetical protein